MNRANHNSLFIFLLPFLLFFACSQPSEPDRSAALGTEFKSFALTTADNPALPVTVVGTLYDDQVDLFYPGTFIPGFRWVARFDTEAVSVELEGQPQISGVSSVDFSTPVTYTLTSSAGQTRQIRAEMQLQPGWEDLGGNPVQGPGSGVFGIRTGMLLDRDPYVICWDLALNLRVYLLGMADGSWPEYTAGRPTLVSAYDALSWNGSIWVVYESAGFIGAQYTVTAPNWSGSVFSQATAGTESLQVFQGSNDRFFAAWIEDPLNKIPQIWTYDGSSFYQLGGDLSAFHTESFAAVSAGGMTVYGVCTFSENPGILHLFEYDSQGNRWIMTRDGGTLNKEADQKVLKLFYDTDKQRPVVFTAVPVPEDPGFYTIRALYWSSTAGLWTDLNSISSLSISAYELSSISISWFDNTPSIALGNRIMTWSANRWKMVGSSYTTDTPAVQSLTTGILDTFISAYTTDPNTGELTVRIIQ